MREGLVVENEESNSKPNEAVSSASEWATEPTETWFTAER